MNVQLRRDSGLAGSLLQASFPIINSRDGNKESRTRRQKKTRMPNQNQWPVIISEVSTKVTDGNSASDSGSQSIAFYGLRHTKTSQSAWPKIKRLGADLMVCSMYVLYT